jgi:H/ACA ribonucleoprotein complex subunit 4
MTKHNHILPADTKHLRLVKTQAKTNPHYGCKPSERSIHDLLDCGIIILDKPCGPTSHQVDSWVKKIFSLEKVGHGGTLDPNATGILPLALGRATRALDALLPGGKEYVAIMQLHKDANDKKIHEICNSFVGGVRQLPPVRSAVKRVQRKRNIYYLDVLQIQGREVVFRVGCESGTYIRTLCVDIGRKLKTGAHLAELRRTRVAHLHEQDTVLLQDVKDAYVFYKEEQDEQQLRRLLLPVETIVKHLPMIVIRDSAVDALCHGAELAVPGVVEIDAEIKKGELVAVMTLKGEAVAIASSIMPTEQIVEKDTGICAQLEKVLMKKGTYPAIWKKS